MNRGGVVCNTSQRHQFFMVALIATHTQKAMGQNAAFKKGLELLFDKIGQPRPGLSLDLGEEGLDMCLQGCRYK